MSQEAGWITTEAAAEIMGVRPESVQRLCKNGGILCQKFGMVWQVWRESAEEYIKSKGGRPKKDN